MPHAFICDAIRTPIGRYGGVLANIRTDDLAAIPIRALKDRLPNVDWREVDDVLLGCANQAGEDNRNVARMALLLAGLPPEIPGVTVNRLCASGLESIAMGARGIETGEVQLIVAGGVEHMTRAPFVMAKAAAPFARNAEIFDTTMGWRFINESLKKMYGVDTMPETAEILAEEHRIARADQDRFACWSQSKAALAVVAGTFAKEIVPVEIAASKGEPTSVHQDEHPRETSIEQLSRLKTPFRTQGTVTAGNSSGINDGAAALLLANETMLKRFNLRPRARVVGSAAAGVAPRTMGLGPVDATEKLLTRLGKKLAEIDIIELNEAFASQALACTRAWKLDDQDPRINPHGGAIALGHPLGMTGTRLVQTAVRQLEESRSARLALCTMCVGVGQGMSMLLERV